ncbi:MAG: hypothetical protein H6Q74_3231 [Firmicutes bacterium]|nr:hypothetical protein [Bacillota bacterium]
MKKILAPLLATFLLLIVMSFAASAAQIENTEFEPFWRIDTQNQAKLPRNFRTCEDEFKYDADTLPSRQGLAALHMSGSAQFSELEFNELIKALAGKENIVVVDLRQESHGLINGNGVSWYAKRNWGNLGKPSAQIIQEEENLLHTANNQTITATKLADSKHGQNQTIDMQITSALTEKEFLTAKHVGYLRLTATDHIAPNDESVDQFIQFYKSMPKNTWLHFHCQAGEGRTTTFMVMYDILRNAKQVSFDDIVKRQYLLGGADLLQVKDNGSWKVEYVKKRIEFLKSFYAYVQQNPETLPVTWSKWQKANSGK